MKRNCFLAVVLIAVFCGMIFGVVRLNNPGLLEKEQENTEGIKPEVNWREVTVARGRVPYIYEAQGNVDCAVLEGYIETIVVEGVTEANFTVLKHKGDEVGPEDAIYRFRKHEKTAGCRAKVTEVRFEDSGDGRNAVIDFLNYDRLCIRTVIDSDMLSEIGYETAVTVSADGKEYPGKIEDIDYRVINGRVAVRLSCEGRLLPGTDTALAFTYEVRENALRVPADMIYQTGSGWRAQVYSGGRLETRNLKTGMQFTDPEDGVLYIEILEGLKEGEKLVVEEIVDQNPEEKESGS